MICRSCGREIPDNSIFCNWCGEKQIRERRKKAQGVKVPKAVQLPSGAWFIRLRLGGQSYPITRATEKDARQEAERIKTAWRAGEMQRRSDKTLKQAAEEYIAGRKSRRSPSTIQGYQKILDNYFQDLLPQPCGKITWEVMDKAIAAECARVSSRGKPMSPKTVTNAALFYVGVLRAEGITFSRELALPEVKRRPVQVPTAEEVYEAVKGTEIELPCLLAMWMTLSISEIRGLTKSKSINGDQLTVVETVVDIDGKPVRKEGGKEVERTRTQTMPPYIKQLIDAVPGDTICPLSSQATNKRLQRRLEKCGVRTISFHKLRHISASTMAALGIPSLYIQQHGGWKSDNTLKAVYEHTYPAERLAADEKIDAHFGKIVGVQNDNKNANAEAVVVDNSSGMASG